MLVEWLLAQKHKSDRKLPPLKDKKMKLWKELIILGLLIFAFTVAEEPDSEEDDTSKETSIEDESQTDEESAESTETDYKSECKELGTYARFKYDGDCKKYVECQTDGTGEVNSCPLGLAYDSKTESCTWISDVGSCSNGSTSTSTGDDCTRSDGKSCKDDEKFDAMRGICTKVGTVVCAKGESIPKCSTDTSYSEKFIADKEDCASYYYCDASNKRYKGSCTSGYYFNPAKQMCVNKDSTCKAIITSSSSTSTSTSTTIDWNTICNGYKNEFIPDPRLCNAYIYCNGDGRARQDFCPTGSYFNNGSCSKTQPSSCTCESFLKEDQSTNYEEAVSHTEKNKYYVCMNGDRILQECGGSSVYDQASQSCTL